METLPNNILEPIDPLDISFSEEKCVKTPETRKTEKNSSPGTSQSLVKDYKRLFDHKSNSVMLKRGMTPKPHKF